MTTTPTHEGAARGREEGPVTSRLITPGGLARRFGVSASHVRELLSREDAPRPLEVEGSERLTVYDTERAVGYLRLLIRPRG